jgi:hypothetical protein
MPDDLDRAEVVHSIQNAMGAACLRSHGKTAA